MSAGIALRFGLWHGFGLPVRWPKSDCRNGDFDLADVQRTPASRPDPCYSPGYFSAPLGNGALADAPSRADAECTAPAVTAGGLTTPAAARHLGVEVAGVRRIGSAKTLCSCKGHPEPVGN